MLFSRPGCHLCDEMKAAIDLVARDTPLSVEVVDISGRADLEAAYGLEIPVLLIDGRKAAKVRVSVDELRRKLEAPRTAPTLR